MMSAGGLLLPCTRIAAVPHPPIAAAAETGDTLPRPPPTDHPPRAMTYLTIPETCVAGTPRRMTVAAMSVDHLPRHTQGMEFQKAGTMAPRRRTAEEDTEH